MIYCFKIASRAGQSQDSFASPCAAASTRRLIMPLAGSKTQLKQVAAAPLPEYLIAAAAVP